MYCIKYYNLLCNKFIRKSTEYDILKMILLSQYISIYNKKLILIY